MPTSIVIVTNNVGDISSYYIYVVRRTPAPQTYRQDIYYLVFVWREFLVSPPPLLSRFIRTFHFVAQNGNENISQRNWISQIDREHISYFIDVVLCCSSYYSTVYTLGVEKMSTPILVQHNKFPVWLVCTQLAIDVAQRKLYRYLSVPPKFTN